MRSEKLKLLLKMELKKLLKGSLKRKKAIKIWQYVLSVAVILIYVVMFTFLGKDNPERSLIYFSMVATVIVLMGVINSGTNSLFGETEMNILIPMPLTEKELLWSKLTGILIVDVLYSAIIMLFPMVVYNFITAKNIVGGLLGIVMLLFFPLVPMAVGIFISTVFRKYVKFKYKSQLATGFFAILVVAIYLGIYVFRKSFSAQLPSLMKKVIKAYYVVMPQAKFFIKGIVDGNVLSAGIFILISVVVTALATAYVAKNHFNIYRALKGTATSSAKVKKKKTGIRVRSKFMANYIKEWKLYFNYPVYFANTVFGVLAIVLMAIVMIVAKPESLNEMAGYDLSSIMGVYGIFIACGLINMSDSTSSAFSIEGKNVWIPFTAPMSIMDIALPKIAVSITLTIVPLLVYITAIVMKFPVEQNMVVLFYLFPIAYQFLSSTITIFLDIKWARYDWINPQEVVKQRFSIFVAMLIVLIPIGITLLFAFLIKSMFYATLIITVAMTIIEIMLLIKLKNMKVYEN